MAETVVLDTEKRQERGTRRAKALRAHGRIPAVIYGHKEQTVSLSLSAEELGAAIRHGARVVDLKTEQGVEKALIRELQWDHLGKELLHVDFERVSADERIEVPVRIEIKGVAPGVTAGGVLDQPIHSLTVECLPGSIPESIRVNINELQIDGAIHVRDLTLPEGVKVVGDLDAIIVQVMAPAAEKEEAVVEAAESAEPEVIGKPKTEEEGEE